MAAGAALPSGLFNVIVMGISFLFIMGGYMTTQNFATSLLDFGPCLPLGSICMGLLYVVFAFACFLAPAAIERLGGAARAMFVGSLAYPLFIVSAVYILTPVMLLTSIVIGLCAALLNVGQGVLMTECCDTPHGREHNGLYNGVFMTLQQGAGLLGNLLAAFIVQGGDDDDDAAAGARCERGGMDLVLIGWQPHYSPFFALLALLAAVGSCCLLRLRPLPKPALPPPPPRQQQQLCPATAQGKAAGAAAFDDGAGAGAGARSGSTLGQALRRTCALALSPRMRDLVPACCYTGLSQAFWSGLFTLRLGDVLDDAAIGRTMVVLSVGEVLGGVAWGAAIDSPRLWGGSARGAALAVVAVQLLGLGAAYAACGRGGGGSGEGAGFAGLSAAGVADVAGGLLGFADAGIFTVVYALITRRFGDDQTGEVPTPRGGMAGATAAEVLLPGRPGYAFTSSDAFAVLMFAQSLTTGICFGIVPLLAGAGFVPGVLFVGAFELLSVAALFTHDEEDYDVAYLY